MTTSANRKIFQAELIRQYERLFAERPLEYAYAMKTHTPASLAEKMTTSLSAGTGNIDGEGIKRACKALGVKHTYKALGAYLKG